MVIDKGGHSSLGQREHPKTVKLAESSDNNLGFAEFTAH